MDTSAVNMLYSKAMPRGPKPKPLEEVTVNVGLKVLPAIKTEIKSIIKELNKTVPGRITEAWLAHKFFMRGLEAYRRDGKIVGAAPAGRKARPVISLKAKSKPAKKKGVSGDGK